MKTFVKIALIAAITAIAVLSCEPGLSPHNDYWGDYNKQFDGSTYIGVTESSPSFTINYSGILTGAEKVSTITITFPDTADVLKQNNPEPELKKFLSFWTFNPNAAVGTGDVSELTELNDWTLQRSVGKQFYVDLITNFATPWGVVVKIDGTKYTYSNGKKMDRDGNGITGEADYDDYYSYQTSSGTFVRPGNRGWTVTFTPPSLGGSGTNDTYTEVNLSLAAYNITGISQSDIDEILRAFAGCFKIEEFSDGKWSTHAVAEYDETSRRIIVKEIMYSNMKGYRAVFEKGSISFETEKVFFGVKQRIGITYDGETIFNTKIKVTRLEGEPGLYYNINKRSFNSFPPVNISVYSKDVFDKNVVLKLKMPDSSAGYYFKAVDLDTFKNNFKIYESTSYDFDEALDRREIGITAVEFKREDASSSYYGDNVIYITLDPAYRNEDNNNYKHFYIGDGISYESGIGVFSSTDIWSNNGFKAHNLGSNRF